MGTIGAGLTVAQKIQWAAGKREFIGLLKTKPQGFEWILCAYAYGNYHQLYCDFEVQRCLDCNEECCGHALTQCDNCNDPVCNICAWSVRLNMKTPKLARKCSEITLCGQCKIKLTKKKKNFWSNIWDPWDADDDDDIFHWDGNVSDYFD